MSLADAVALTFTLASSTSASEAVDANVLAFHRMAMFTMGFCQVLDVSECL
jgi:hypothetical protein